ncbi:unnamed protein product, partial [Staurois parvus]
MQGPGRPDTVNSGSRETRYSECRDSGVCYIQIAGLRGVLHTDCRTQGCATYRLQDSGVCYIQIAGLRGVLHTDCRTQGCATYRLQDSGVCYIQIAGLR